MSLTISDTAYAIAKIRAMEAERAAEERLFDDPYAQAFVDAGAHAREGVERFRSLPFFEDGIRLRTRQIDDVVCDAIRDGARQLVLLGAGFDARAHRIPAVARHDVNAFEIDFESMLETKSALVAKSGLPLHDAVHYVACDFTANFESGLTEALRAAGFDASKQTIFVWEGVVAYLNHEAINRTMAWMGSMSAKGSVAIFDFSELGLEPDPAAARAQRSGFAAFHEVGFDELWRKYLMGEPHPSASFVKMGIALR